MSRWIVAGLVLAGGVFSGGCAEETFSKSVWNPFDVQPLFSSGVEPVRIGITREKEQKGSILNPVTWVRSRRTPWMSLERELSRQLQRPVVIGHSMGGLDARYAASPAGLNQGHRIHTITTLSTPHHGAYMAEQIPSWLRTLISSSSVVLKDMMWDEENRLFFFRKVS